MVRHARPVPAGVDPQVRQLARSTGFAAKRIMEAVAEGRPADRELSRLLKNAELVHPRDGRFVSRAIFAAFRWWGWTRPLLEREIAHGLLASYLLDSGPYHAVTTDWARRYDIKGVHLSPPAADAGLEARSGWLRAFLDVKTKFNPLALVPAWFYRELHNPHGRPFERELLASMQRPAPSWIRRVDDRPLEGVTLESHPRAPLAARVISEGSLYEHPAFKAGAFEIQDLASQAVGLACAPGRTERWWDACAGGGGKALQLASMLKGRGTVIATDVKDYKLEEAKRRAARGKLHNLSTRAWDGKTVPAKAESFDGVLVDAPCSGVGTWRRNPDARWRTSADDVHELAGKQRTILSRAAAGVRPGGVLVYAVCTLTTAETIGVADAFLAEHADFAADPVAHPLSGDPTDGRIWIWPQQHDSDGMFIARFRRKP